MKDLMTHKKSAEEVKDLKEEKEDNSPGMAFAEALMKKNGVKIAEVAETQKE